MLVSTPNYVTYLWKLNTYKRYFTGNTVVMHYYYHFNFQILVSKFFFLNNKKKL